MTTPNTDLAEQIEASAREVMRRSALIADVDLPAYIAAAVLPIVEAAVKRGQAEALRDAATGIEKSDRSLPGMTVSDAVRSLRFRADDLEGGDPR
ncbi:hypothetical protein [Brachybacterium nesterenkovii]|uniref:hypothetical protein n=1 Tax=Brachybacterium nesterenkovii TaxID=47847 RepID=UPI003218E7BE